MMVKKVVSITGVCLVLSVTSLRANFKFDQPPVGQGMVCSHATAMINPAHCPIPYGGSCDDVSCCNESSMCTPWLGDFAFAAANTFHSGEQGSTCVLESEANGLHASAVKVTLTDTSIAVAGQTLAIHTSTSKGTNCGPCAPGIGHVGSSVSDAELNLAVPFVVTEDTSLTLLLSSLTRNVDSGSSEFTWSIENTGLGDSHTIAGIGTVGSPQTCVTVSAGSYVLEVHYETSLGALSGVGGLDCGGSDSDTTMGGDAWGMLVVCGPCATCTCECKTGADCDDGLFCSGTETCVNGICEPGNSPCSSDLLCDEDTDQCVECLADPLCEDGVACTVDTCENGFCQHTPDNGACDYCSGEVCDAVLGCVASGGVPCPDPMYCDSGLCQCTDCPGDLNGDRLLYC